MDLREFINRINNGEDPKEIDMEESRKKVMKGKTKEEYLKELEILREQYCAEQEYLSGAGINVGTRRRNL